MDELKDELSVHDNSTNEGEHDSAGTDADEVLRLSVMKIQEKRRKDGNVFGAKDIGGENLRRMTPKMKAFASNMAQGLGSKEAYKKAYNAESMSEASVIAEANKLCKDPRINILMTSVWEEVRINIIDDAVATRRKIMSDLIKHADNSEAKLNDRLKSLELMGRAIGMFTDKTETKSEIIDTEKLKAELESHAKHFTIDANEARH
jgi:hypothetical protein